MINTINLKDKKITFDRIIGYGCSFMAGAESIDHTVRIDMSKEEVENVKKLGCGPATFYTKCVRPEDAQKGLINPDYVISGQINFEEIQKREKQNSWFRFFCDNFKGNHLNRAESGAGLEYMVHCYINDMFEKKISEKDLILVALTSTNRFFYYTSCGKFKNSLLVADTTWPSTTLYKEYITHLGNENNLFWNYLKNLHFFKNIKNQVIFVPQWINDFSITETSPVIKNLWTDFLTWEDLIPLQDINFRNYKDFGYNILHEGKVIGTPEMCGIHPSKEQHERFALDLYEYLKI